MTPLPLNSLAGVNSPGKVDGASGPEPEGRTYGLEASRAKLLQPRRSMGGFKAQTRCDTSGKLIRMRDERGQAVNAEFVLRLIESYGQIQH